MMITIPEIREAEELVEVLEGALEALPTLIFIMKLGIVLGRRELREAGMGDLLDRVEAPPVEAIVA